MTPLKVQIAQEAIDHLKIRLGHIHWPAAETVLDTPPRRDGRN